MKKERVTYYDSVGGILLVHMILFHCCQWAHVNDRLQTVLFFFMTWFFFKSGLFYRVSSLKEEVCKSFKRLIVPFIIFSVPGTIVLWIKYFSEGNLTIHSMISSVSQILVIGSPLGNLPLWFLTSLFSVRILYSLVFNHLKTSVLRGGVIALLSAVWIAVYTIQIRGIKLPIYLSNISTGMMFFSFGYLAKKIVTSKKVEFSILICYIIAVAFLDIKIDMRVGTFEPNCFYWIPICLLGIYAINIAAKYLMNKPNIWSYIGKNSMGFYCLHWLIIQIISLFFVDDGTSNIPFLITLVIGNIIILPILVMLIKKSKYKSIIE